MKSTQRRMIAVAIAVCGFAVGMSGLLNYFKYRATTDRILEQRLVYIGKSVRNNIQASLALGLQISDIGTLPALLRRESDGDELIAGIDVVDGEGRLLYSTDPARRGGPAPAVWQAAAAGAGADHPWSVHEGPEPVVGIPVQNHFGLAVGQLVLRYAPAYREQAARAVVRDLALSSLAVFACAALLASLALRAVMGGIERDLQALETALRSDGGMPAAVQRGPFGQVLARFAAAVRETESELAEVRALLRRGAGT